MQQKDKDNLKGMIKTCLKESVGYIFENVEGIFPFFEYSLTDKIVRLLDQKLNAVSAIYNQKDIYFMIVAKAAVVLDYKEVHTSMAAKTGESKAFNIGKLVELIKESKLNDIANSVIKELEYPSKTYVLVKLPNIGLSSNIKIANGFFLISDTEYLVRFGVDNNFNFQLESDKNYLLMEETGVPWNLNISKSLLYKNILLKLKTFLGLLLITDTVTTTRTFVNTAKNKGRTSVPIGIFSASPGIWSEDVSYEGASEEEVESGSYDPISEDHPDFEALKNSYSKGDAFREFPFQKAFRIEGEINLSQVYTDFINSLSISEYATKPSFSLIMEEIEKPLPQFEGFRTPTEHLEEHLKKIRILLSSRDDYAKRIKSASLWYLEGHCAEDDTFKFIAYTISIECLLGHIRGEGKKGKEGDNKEPPKEPPLTKTLSDRCGFTLGKSLKEKEEIAKEFGKIYGIRSDIVHRRKIILSKDENEYLEKLEKRAKGVIKNVLMNYEEEP